MIKKIILGVAALSLVGASLMYMSSCAIKQGPLSPNTSQISSTDSRSTELPAASPMLPTTPLGLVALTGEVRITFDKKMNNTTLNTANVLIYYKNVATDDTQEAQYTEFSITYVDAIKTLILRPTNAAGWLDNTRFRVQLLRGITSAAGAPLDGNDNGINDGNILDDYDDQFYTDSGGLTHGSYDLLDLTVVSVPVEALGGNVGDLAFGNAGNVPAMYTYVTITAQFSNNLDVSTVFTSASQLHPNFSVVNVATGATPTIITIEALTNYVMAVFVLDPASRYKLTVLGGLVGVRSSSDATEILNRGKYFAGDDAVAEAADKVEAYLSTAAADNSAITYPDVTGYAYTGGTTRMFRISFNPDQMDATTLTNANILLIGRYPQSSSGTVYNIVPKLIDIHAGELVVDVYLPSKIYPAEYGSPVIEIDAKVVVKRYVKSALSQYLDVDGDNVVLTDDDDYNPIWTTVDSSE